MSSISCRQCGQPITFDNNFYLFIWGKAFSIDTRSTSICRLEKCRHERKRGSNEQPIISRQQQQDKTFVELHRQAQRKQGVISRLMNQMGIPELMNEQEEEQF
jgi:hypothetical protein